jgi:hypothetical protein
MKLTLSLAFLLAAFGAARAQIPDGQSLGDLHWHAPVEKSPPGLTLSGVGTMDPDTHLFLAFSAHYTGTSPLQKRLFYIPRMDVSGISTHHYAITGEVAYENVAPGSYLEMWSYFDSPAPGYPEGAYFSRTMADGGPMGKLDGTSGWREFWLPFDSTGTTSKLRRLEMNLHLTGPGTVHFRNMKLMQYPDASAATADNSATQLAPTASTPSTGPKANLVPQSIVDSARTAFTIAQNQYSAGTGDYLAVLETYQHLQWAEAMFAGDRIAAARANRDGAKKRLEIMEREYSAGSLDFAKLAPVQNELAAAEASLSELESKQNDQLGAPSARLFGIDWRSFLLGVAATGLMLLVITGLIFIWRLWQRRHHERELRRIASLDS